MKYLLIFLFIISLISCKKSQEDLLIGEWELEGVYNQGLNQRFDSIKQLFYNYDFEIEIESEEPVPIIIDGKAFEVDEFYDDGRPSDFQYYTVLSPACLRFNKNFEGEYETDFLSDLIYYEFHWKINKNTLDITLKEDSFELRSPIFKLTKDSLVTVHEALPSYDLPNDSVYILYLKN